MHQHFGSKWWNLTRFHWTNFYNLFIVSLSNTLSLLPAEDLNVGPAGLHRASLSILHIIVALVSGRT